MQIEQALKSLNLINYSGAYPAALHVPPAFLEALPIAIYACDERGRLLWFNQRAVALWGRTPKIGDDSELFCGFYKAFLNGTQIGHDECPMAQVLRSGVSMHDAQVVLERPDGSRVQAQVHIDPIKDAEGRVVGGINCFHDVSEAARLRQTLEQSHRDLDDFFENGAVGLHLVAGDGTILRANKAELDLLGYAAEEYVGRNICEFHADAATINNILGCLTRGEKLDKYPARLRAKDGTIKDVLITSNVQFRNGEFINTRCFTIDVTEWKKTSELLREKDQRLAATYEHAGIGISEVDAQCRRMQVNETACKIMGRSREELIGSSPFALLHPGEGDEDFRQHQRMVAGEIERYACENRYIKADGSVLCLDVVSSAVRDATGKFLYGVRVFRDATKARQAAAALAESSQRLAATYEHAGIAITEVDESGRIVRVNEGSCKISGYARDELLGRIIFDPVHPDSHQTDYEQFKALVRDPTRRYTVEKRLRRKDGGIIWALVDTSAVRDDDGNFLYAIRVVHDVTERKKAVEVLRERERQFRELLEALPVAIYTTDAAGRVNFFNRTARELAGREPQLGKDQWCVTWRLYKPDGTNLPHEECPMAVALAENRPVRGKEVLVERPDGLRVPVIPYPTPIHDEHGTLTGAVNVLVDISERRQSEANQRMLLAELNHRVKNNMQMLHSLLRSAERFTDNAQARSVLADASQRVAAMGAAQKVLYGSGDAITYDAAEFLEAVCASAKQAVGRDIKIAIEESTGAKLSNDTAMPLALILNELITNSAKYGANARGEGTVRIQMKRLDDTFVLVVQDDGPGFVLDRARRQTSGLGLVVGLARQLGGTFKVERGPGARCILQFADQNKPT